MSREMREEAGTGVERRESGLKGRGGDKWETMRTGPGRGLEVTEKRQILGTTEFPARKPGRMSCSDIATTLPNTQANGTSSPLLYLSNSIFPMYYVLDPFNFVCLSHYHISSMRARTFVLFTELTPEPTAGPSTSNVSS